MNLFYLTALQIKDKFRLFMISVNFPIKIGCDIKPCPHCGAPMSFAYDHYFCRACGYNQNGNEILEIGSVIHYALRKRRE